MEALYNINMERAILSSIIFEPKTYEEVASVLKPEDFYLPFHQYLFRAMEELFDKELPIDEEFLKKELEKIGKFDEVLMVEVLSANSIINTKAYISELKSLANKRALLGLSTEIKKLVMELDLDVMEVMNRVEKKLYEITLESSNNDFRDSKEITVSTLKEIERLKAMGQL